MDTKKPTDTAATVIIGQKVRAGSEQAFEAWQQEMNSEAVEVPRFHRRRDQPADRRATRLGGGLPLRLDRACSGVDQQRHAPGETRRRARSSSTARAPSRSSAAVPARPTPWSPSSSPTASSRRTSTEFLAWQDRLRLAESKFPGFRGTELFRPVEGIQEEWTALYRYETADDLDRWLISDERKELLAEGEKFSDFHLRTVDNSFGSWFAFDEHGNRGAATVGDSRRPSRSGWACTRPW